MALRKRVIRLFTLMKNTYQTTDISNKDIEPEKKSKRKYNFPEHGVTVEATSLEEAKKELYKLINK